MKKRLITLLILVYSLSVYAGGIFVKYGTSENPRLELNGDDEIYDRTVELTLEILGELSDTWDIGGGTEIGTRFKRDEGKSGIGYVPFYLAVRKKFRQENQGSFPYMIGRVGVALPVEYADELSNASGGLHIGLGFGVEVSHFVIEMVGTRSTVSPKGVSGTDLDDKATFSKLTFSIGYRFGKDYGTAYNDRHSRKIHREDTYKEETYETKPEMKMEKEKNLTPTDNSVKTDEIKNSETETTEKIYDDLLDSTGEEDLSKQNYIDSRIKELDEMKDQGLITNEEYQTEKELIINE